MRMDVIRQFPQACMWLDLLSVRRVVFSTKNLQLSLAECREPSQGPWVVQYLCGSHTYGVNGGLALCTQAQTKHTQSNYVL